MRSRQTGCGLLRDPSFNRAVEKSLFWAEIAIKPLVWGTFFLDKRDALVYKYIQLREKAGQRNRLIIRKKNSRQGRSCVSAGPRTM